MSISLLFKIAAVGILVSVLGQVLKHAGREEQAFLTSLAGLLLVLGFSTLSMSWCVVGEWLGAATKWCTWVMREAVEWVESLPFSTTQIHLSSESVVGLYCAFICGLLMLRGGKVHWWWLIGVVVSLVGIMNFELRIMK